MTLRPFSVFSPPQVCWVMIGWPSAPVASELAVVPCTVQRSSPIGTCSRPQPSVPQNAVFFFPRQPLRRSLRLSTVTRAVAFTVSLPLLYVRVSSPVACTAVTW